MPKKRKNSKQNPASGSISSDLNYRTLAITTRADGMPDTLDEKNRSVEVVGATENPVSVFDWERGEVVNEVLLMSGCQMPGSRQIPLLDTHSRWDTKDIIGSYRGMTLSGAELIGRSFFSEVEDAQDAYQKVCEGHLTDFSIGYRVLEATYIPQGEKQTINGREFEGPVKVATRWVPKELSACPIGADEAAKARAATAPVHSADHTERQNPKEVTEMDEKTRKYLESRGLAKDATEADAYRYLEEVVIPDNMTAPSMADSDEKKREEIIISESTRAEQSRILEIRAMCDQAKQADMADEFIIGNKSVEEARKAVFDAVTAKAPEPTGYRSPIEVGTDAKEKFRSAAEDALILRSGSIIETPAMGARDLMGYSLVEMARESLRVGGFKTNGNTMEMTGRALTVSDFPFILANIANKSLAEGYESSTETFPQWCGEGSVSDFKINTKVRASETDDLDEIQEGDEYKHGSRSESKEEYSIATYGKLFPISRQAMINDDLGAFIDTPRNHGEAASRKVGDVTYAVLTANSAMGDGVALFHANHSNIGVGGVIGETTVGDGIKKMKLQKDIAGKRRLNIRPEFLIAPVALEGSAEVFFNSGQFAGANEAATRTNPYAGNRFTRVYEPRLDDDSSLIWYLAGARGKTVVVYYLNGQKAPYLETKQGWDVDGVEFKVRIDAGAKAMDWKTILKNAGV